MTFALESLKNRFSRDAAHMIDERQIISLSLFLQVFYQKS